MLQNFWKSDQKTQREALLKQKISTVNELSTELLGKIKVLYDVGNARIQHEPKIETEEDNDVH